MRNALEMAAGSAGRNAQILGGRMDWLREVFWVFNAVTGYITVLPLAVAGAVAALVIGRRPGTSRWLIHGVCILVAGAVSSLFYGPPGFLLVMSPVTPYSPYANAASMFMFWLPVGMQGFYVHKSPRPRWYAAAGLAVVGVFLGGLIIATVGGAVGAQTD